MTQIRKISFLLLAVLFAFGMEATAESVNSDRGIDYNVELSEQQPSFFHENLTHPFAIHRQGQRVTNHLKNNPFPNVKNIDQGTTNHRLHSELAIHHSVALFLFHSRDIDLSLTIRELLFPFHHFL